MNQMHDKHIADELARVASPSEVAGLLDIVDKLHTHAPAATTRSQQAHATGLDIVRERIAEQSATRQWWRSWQLSAVPAGLLVGIALIVGLSQMAGPTSVLYGTKRASESVRLSLAHNPASKAQLCSTYMIRRANELAAATPASLTQERVVSLTDAIMEEAEEFGVYTAQAPAATQLSVQRERDARYVIEALREIPLTSLDATSQSAISATIAAMQQITDEAG